METLTAFLSFVVQRVGVSYTVRSWNASGTKSIYVTSCVPVWRRPHCPTRPGTGRAAEPRADQRRTTEKRPAAVVRAGRFSVASGPALTAQPVACDGRADDDLDLVAIREQQSKITTLSP